MPTYQITSPDGRTFRVTAPEGASEQDILNYVQSNAPQEQPRSFVSDFPKGFGQSFSDTSKGLAQIGLGGAASVAGGMGYPETQDKLQGGLDYLTRRIQNPSPDEAALRRSPGGISGNIAGTIAQMALPATAIAGRASAIPQVAKYAPLLGDVVSAGALGASQPMGEDDSRLAAAGDNAALAGVGSLFAKGLGKIVQAGKEPLVKAAEKYGIPLGIAQLSESPLLRGITTFADSFSLTNPKARLLDKFTQAVGRDVGADSTTLTDDVLKAAKDEWGNKFNQAYSYGLSKADDLKVKMADFLRKKTEVLTPKQVSPLQESVSDIEGKITSGQIAPDALENLNKTLRDSASQALENKNSVVAGATRELSDLLDNSLMSELPEDVAQGLTDARTAWRKIKTIEPLASRNAGKIPPNQLLNRLSSDYGNQTSRAGDLGEIAQIGKKYLPNLTSESPTAQRLLLASTVGGLGYGATGDPQTAAMMALAGTGMSEALRSQLVRKLLFQPAAQYAAWSQPQYLGPAMANLVRQQEYR